MTQMPEPPTEQPQRRPLWERLDDAIAAVNPDLWLAGAVLAVAAPVVLPWLTPHA